jgi:ankyrin repeat protein
MGRWHIAVLGLITLTGTLFTQTSKVEFSRDVQPILRERCYSCHGSSQQMQGLRLDLRRVAMPNRVGANRASIVPGNSAASPVYLKLIGKQAGLQMPPDGALSAEQINLIKTWIDQGADWPDALSGDAPQTIADPRAVQIMDALRDDDRRSFLKILNETPDVSKMKGRSGTTPLMYAVLYGDADTVKLLLDKGADANARNDANATALMYAIDDADKTAVLLNYGADPNARSEDGQTPLLIATSRPGAAPVVKLLLEHNANPSMKSPTGRAPLTSAALAGAGEVLRLLIDHDAEKRPLPLAQAVRAGCEACIDLLFTQTLVVADVAKTKMLLDRGATPSPDILSSLALSPATFSSDLIQTLISGGANINANTRVGSILNLAKRQGDTALVRALTSAGAKLDISSNESSQNTRKPAATVRAAIERSLPPLDRADVAFIKKAGCISCHNNSLRSMARAAARTNGIGVNETIASSQVKTISAILDANRERALQALGLPGGLDTAGYILLGLAAEKYQANEITDAWARYLKNLQQTDGRWRIQAQRPPLESSDIQATATALRAIQLYTPKPKREEYRSAVELAARWLEHARPSTTEDRAFLMLGLHWAGGSAQVIDKVAKELLSEQRSDGGWSQLSTLPSDAYATGQALFALAESRRLAGAHPAYRRGVQYLMDSQLDDGSWYVETRTLPVQPYFDSEFPHGANQFISAAATNWATMGLAAAK